MKADSIDNCAHVRLEELDAPVALCLSNGEVLTATKQAVDLLRRVKILEQLPGRLPRELWDALERVPPGEAVDWRPPGDVQNVLGCTRYHYDGRYMLLMKEVSHKHAALSRRLHSQRLEATGRLVASVAHELRNAVASIVYSAELLGMEGYDVTPESLQETVGEMATASRQLQSSVDSLLGYARLGPSVFVPVSLRDVLTRAQGFLRSIYRDGKQQLHIDIPSAAEWVQGNTLTIEQIFVNLLLNAAEAAENPLTVTVEADLAPMPPGWPSNDLFVRVRVRDNGPGIPTRLRDSIFQPFFSTREKGTGLGLTIAIEAATSLGGALLLEDQGPGACFAVYLPRKVEAS